MTTVDLTAMTDAELQERLTEIRVDIRSLERVRAERVRAADAVDDELACRRLGARPGDALEITPVVIRGCFAPAKPGGRRPVRVLLDSVRCGGPVMVVVSGRRLRANGKPGKSVVVRQLAKAWYAWRKLDIPGVTRAPDGGAA